MIPKSGHRFPAFAKPASAGEGRSEKIMLNQKAGSWRTLRKRPMAIALPLCAAPTSKRELQLAVGIKDEKNFREAHLRPALEARLLERTIPEKPQSSKQRYRLIAGTSVSNAAVM
jgi:hypothetical protein